METFIPSTNKVILLLILLSAQWTMAQSPRLSFWRTSAFYETGSTKALDGTTNSVGNAAGVEINVNPTYDGFETGDKIVVGWSLNGTFGYNFLQRSLRPWRFDIGFWGGYMVTDDIEVGMQYCFLGVYAWQTYQVFGSTISPAVKYKNFQLTLSRAGDGALTGCFVPRFNSDAIHSGELMYCFKQFMVGGRVTSYADTNEFRILFAKNFGELN